MRGPSRKREFLPPPPLSSLKSSKKIPEKESKPSKLILPFVPKHFNTKKLQTVNAEDKLPTQKRINPETYTINGININFPYKAYACQLNMMDKITRVLNSNLNENALLESPTGSGKSLSILCSVLSWFSHQKSKATLKYSSPTEENFSTEVEEIKLAKESKGNTLPKIYICSRTHRQLTQLVKELESTSYRPKMAVLGSRNHLCLQHQALNSSDPNEKCKELVKDGACRYYHKSDTLAKAMKDSVWDIEDLVTTGRELKGCPYYASRALAQEAEVIFAPYNYICDPSIREAMGISAKDNVIIIDEAHNIEDTAREAGSYEVTNERLESKQASNRILVIESELVNLSMVYGKKSNSSTLDGIATELRDSYTFLKGVGWNRNPDSYRWCWVYLSLELERDLDQKEKDKLSFLSTGAQNILSGLLFVLKFVFEVPFQKHISDYKMALNDSFVHQKDTTKRQYKLSFWCLNPGIIFGPLAKEAKSIILTSGTLSPMASFASELQTSFAQRLEANHVISPSQIWVGVVPVSPNGLETEGVYRSLDSFSFQDEIGNAILGYLSVIPHGVLCFVPSYSFLKKATSRWKSTGLYNRLSQLKHVLIEPQNVSGNEFQDLLDEYYQSIEESRTEFKRSGNDKGGSLLIAVYRGKVSEGLDFIDDNARAVIAIGIPFPSAMDIQVVAKKDFNTKYASSKGLLTGNQWYEIQAFRALNQALGRCLRHRNDWGAIILLEKRFTQAKNQQQLSKWVRNNTKIHATYQESLSSLSSFMDSWRTVCMKKTTELITELQPAFQDFHEIAKNPPNEIDGSKLPVVEHSHQASHPSENINTSITLGDINTLVGPRRAESSFFRGSSETSPATLISDDETDTVGDGCHESKIEALFTSKPILKTTFSISKAKHSKDELFLADELKRPKPTRVYTPSPWKDFLG